MSYGIPPHGYESIVISPARDKAWLVLRQAYVANWLKTINLVTFQPEGIEEMTTGWGVYGRSVFDAETQIMTFLTEQYDDLCVVRAFTVPLGMLPQPRCYRNTWSTRILHVGAAIAMNAARRRIYVLACRHYASNDSAIVGIASIFNANTMQVCCCLEVC
jgi:hypothetical protein